MIYAKCIYSRQPHWYIFSYLEGWFTSIELMGYLRSITAQKMAAPANKQKNESSKNELSP